MDDLTAKHGIGLAIIYETWFGRAIPANWRRIAILRPHDGRVTRGVGRVSFFATTPAAEGAARAALGAFRPTLGERSDLEIVLPGSDWPHGNEGAYDGRSVNPLPERP